MLIISACIVLLQGIKSVYGEFRWYYEMSVWAKVFEFIICGDINRDYPNERYWKNVLTSLLTTHNLSQTVNFAMWIQNDFDCDW